MIMNSRFFVSQFSVGVVALSAALTGGAVVSPQVLAQQVVNVAPTGSEAAGDSTIAWQFDSVDSVEASSIQVYLNDQEVTSQTIIDTTRNYFGYRPPQDLAPGRYQVRVEFTNTQGARFAATWPFTVADAAVEISSITHNGADQPLGSGASFLATINGTPGATASVLLVQNGQTVSTLPATEVSSGVYVASVTVGNNAVSEGILVGRLTQGSQVVYSVASQSFAFSPGTTTATVSQSQTGGGTQVVDSGVSQTEQVSLTLDVTSHTNRQTISGDRGFMLEGTTAPGATVRVTVVASAPSFGPFSIGGAQNVLENAPAEVDEDGTFAISVPRPGILQGGTQYAVQVTATLDGETEVVELILVQQ